MLSRKYRIKKEDIEKIIKRGKGPIFDFFYVRIFTNNFSNKRFAVIVSKKTQKTSVGRHLLKRRIWAVLDEMNKDNLKGQTDFVFLVKRPFLKKDIAIIRDQIEIVVSEIKA